MRMHERIQKKIESYRFMKKPVIVLSLIYILGISAILRANVSYIDDMGRVAQGYKQWDYFSRYIAYYFSSFLHADHYLTDISPLPQLLAMVFMAMASIIVVYVISNKKQVTFWEYAAVLPVGLSPYFLECISYKYDSPYMALSVLASVFPLLFYKKSRRLYFFVSLVGILTMCMSYQAASGIFPMLVVMLSFQKWNQKREWKNLLTFISVSAAAYIIGLLFFRIFILQPQDTYVSTAVPAFQQLPGVVFENIKEYVSIVRRDLKREWKLLFAILCGVFLYVSVRDSRRKRWQALLSAVVALGMMCVLSFGVYPLLLHPLFEPRALYGIGILIAILGVSVAAAKKAYIGKCICILLSWVFFVFAFTYGNALSIQEEYTRFRIEAVIEDLEDLECFSTGQPVTVQIKGAIEYAPVLRNMPRDYHMLERLIPITFNGEWSWGTYRFYKYYDLKNVKKDSKVDLTGYELPMLKNSMYHCIKGNEQNILIELK